MTSLYMDIDTLTAFIPIFEMDLYGPENFLTSAGPSLGIWHPRFGEKEDLVPDNCKEFLASLDKDEEEIWKSIEPSDLELWSPRPPFVPQSPLWLGYYSSRIRMAKPRHYLRRLSAVGLCTKLTLLKQSSQSGESYGDFQFREWNCV